jgi:hypothetical protein
VLSLSPLSLADVVGRVSGLPPSSSRRQWRLPKPSPIKSSTSISSFLNWSIFGLYKPSLHTFPPPSNHFTMSTELPRRYRELGTLSRRHRPLLQAARLSRFLIWVRWCTFFVR